MQSNPSTDNQLKVTKLPQLKTTESTVSSSLEVDWLYAQLQDLVNEDFKPWYCKQFGRLGRETVLRLASVARSDAKTNPRGYFSVLLKKA